MAYEHRNRRGKVYLLQAGKTKTGKTRYYFGRKLTGTPVEEVPEGYEVFEEPDRAQVFLRKERPSKIESVERGLVAEGVRRFANVEMYDVRVEDDSIVVYVPGMSSGEADRAVSNLAGDLFLSTHRANELRDHFLQNANYDKVMRFELSDEEKRLFVAHRWCFRGSHEGWRVLSPPAPLPNLVNTFVKHIGEESFYEL